LTELIKLKFNVDPVPDGMTSRTFLALLRYSNVKEMEVRGSFVFGDEDMVMNNNKGWAIFGLVRLGLG
jgi:hypothetical protein